MIYVIIFFKDTYLLAIVFLFQLGTGSSDFSICPDRLLYKFLANPERRIVCSVLLFTIL